MENRLLLDQAGPIGSFTPAFSRDERVNDLAGAFLCHGGQFMCLKNLDGLPAGEVLRALFFQLKRLGIHKTIITGLSLKGKVSDAKTLIYLPSACGTSKVRAGRILATLRQTREKWSESDLKNEVDILITIYTHNLNREFMRFPTRTAEAVDQLLPGFGHAI